MSYQAAHITCQLYNRFFFLGGALYGSKVALDIVASNTCKPDLQCCVERTKKCLIFFVEIYDNNNKLIIICQKVEK